MVLSNSSEFSIKLPDEIDVTALVPPFLFKYKIYKYDHNQVKKKQSVRKWNHELDHRCKRPFLVFFSSLGRRSISAVFIIIDKNILQFYLSIKE
jgi:hypothetical protein